MELYNPAVENGNGVAIADKVKITCATNEWIGLGTDSKAACNKCEVNLPGCELCSNANTCFKCRPSAPGDFVTWKLFLSRCVEKCPPGYYTNANNECMACDGCSECTGALATDCTLLPGDFANANYMYFKNTTSSAC